MRNKYAPQSAKKNFLIFSLFLVLCLPLIVWQVLDDDFDIRRMAFEEVSVSEDTPCVISFPSVNPYTIEVGKTVRMQVEGLAKGPGITAIEISEATGEVLFSKEYDDLPKEIAETFEFTPTNSKEYEIIGTLSESEYTSSCIIVHQGDIKGVRSIANNRAPEFTSTPLDSKPSQDIKTGTSYEYTLTATDLDGDFINFSYSFTPTNPWLKHTVINDGSNGNLKIQFKGSTTEPASYLANVFIHDGYSKHLRSQSWIISVSPAENDIPQVTILSPWEALTIAQGDRFKVKWAATDRNFITHFELYLAQSIQDENTWYKIQDDIAYNINEYTIDTTNISAGKYYAIVKAPDNQEPSLVGKGISALIEIVGEEFDMPDDIVQLPEPQIINITPTAEDKVNNPLVTIRASLLASIRAEIEEETIKIKVNDKDVTSLVRFNKVSEAEYTLIYQTEQEYEPGLQKVEISFTDTKGLEAYKSWTFNMEVEEKDPTKFYIFGFEISRLVVYVVAGGILLLLLALIVPLILVKVWKEDDENTKLNHTSQPPQHNDTVEKLVNDDNPNQIFSKLKNQGEDKEIEIPEPNIELQKLKEEPKEEDIKILYEKIKGEGDTKPTE